jgi:hypothetical protein
VDNAKEPLNYQIAIKYAAKWPKYIPNGHKIYQHLSLHDTPKFTQSWIFGFKIHHLATLLSVQTKKPFQGFSTSWSELLCPCE